jgi:hypothetical protein
LAWACASTRSPIRPEPWLISRRRRPIRPHAPTPCIAPGAVLGLGSGPVRRGCVGHGGGASALSGSLLRTRKLRGIADVHPNEAGDVKASSGTQRVRVDPQNQNNGLGALRAAPLHFCGCDRRPQPAPHDRMWQRGDPAGRRRAATALLRMHSRPLGQLGRSDRRRTRRQPAPSPAIPLPRTRSPVDHCTSARTTMD